MDALRIATTGMAAQQTRVDTIANNIANMSTTAYAPRRAAFADLIYRQETAPGTISSRTGTIVPGGVQIGLGVRTAAVTADRVQGTLTTTGEIWMSPLRDVGSLMWSCRQAKSPTHATAAFPSTPTV